MKTCAHCHKNKPLDAFGFVHLQSQQRYSYCRECVSIKAKLRREQHPGDHLAYYKNNKERLLAEKKLYYVEKRQEVIDLYTPSIAIRFYAKITYCDHGSICIYCCHLWNASTNNSGYGQFFIAPGKPFLVHRLAWILHHKKEISQGFLVCHYCDVKPCGNYNHLFLGTPQDNMDDMRHKNRQNYRGTKRPPLSSG